MMFKALTIAMAIFILFVSLVAVTSLRTKPLLGFFSFSRGAKISKGTILYVDLRKPYLEVEQYPFGIFGIFKRPTFPRLLRALDFASEDPRIKAVLIRGPAAMSLSSAWELKKQIAKARKAGKTIYAYYDLATPSDMLLLTECDTIVSPKQAVTAVPGFMARPLFLRGTFDKLGIGFDVIHIGKYKGAGEIFVSDTMSVWLRESYEAFLEDYYNQFVSDLADGYNIPAESVKAIIDGAVYDGKTIPIAIIDSFMHWEEFVEYLVGKEKEKIVSINAYSSLPPRARFCDKKIALVSAEGNIMDESDRTIKGITPKQYAKLIHKLADDDDIDAIIFRVTSPGGSAIASDAINAEIVRAAKKKPVVVSMGSIAASGGYYISMGARRIFATPYTLTGSIGVVMIRPYLQRLYEKIGANPQEIKRGRNADLMTVDKPLTDEQKEIMKRLLLNIYHDFVSKAAEGRDTTYEWIDSIAQGRIWSAADAESLGLIDDFGSLIDAISYAEKLIEVPEGYRAKVVFLPRPKTFFEILEEWNLTFTSSRLPKIAEKLVDQLRLLESLGNKPLYLCPFDAP